MFSRNPTDYCRTLRILAPDPPSRMLASHSFATSSESSAAHHLDAVQGRKVDLCVFMKAIMLMN